MEFWKRLAKNRLLDVGALVIAAVALVRIATMLPERVWWFDFNHFYVGSRMLEEGQNPYTTSLESKSKQLGFAFSPVLPIAGYPPPFLWLFEPLAALPPRRAFAVWVIGEVTCLAAILGLTRSLLRERLSRRGWLFVCAAAVASQTVFWHFCYSQVQLLLAALALAAFAWRRNGKHTAALIAVTAGGLLKFYPFALLPWFVWRSGNNIRTRAAHGTLALAVCVAVVLITGLTLWADFFKHAMPIAVGEEIGRNFHYSLPAIVTNLGLAAAGLDPLPAATRTWWIAGTATGLLLIGGAYWLSFRGARDYEAEFCLLSVTMLSATVTVQGHYFVWLIYPLAAAAARVAARPTAGRVLFLAIVVLLLNQVTPPDPSFLRGHIYLKILANYVPFYALVALGWFWAMEVSSTTATQRRVTGLK